MPPLVQQYWHFTLPFMYPFLHCRVIGKPRHSELGFTESIMLLTN
jgi:hypothetical protein